MHLEIQVGNTLSDLQKQALGELTKAVYPPTTAPKNTLQWASASFSVLIWDNQHLVSHVGALVRAGTFNGEAVSIGGIGQVKTHPDARGQGYASQGINAATRYLREQFAVDFLLLVCRESLLRYYERLGWHHFQGDVWVDQPSGKEKFIFNEPMCLPGKQEVPQNGMIDLCGLPW
ncbi:MAG: GNAT family N-acetyltransferase [Chloroflexota bacterium]